MVGCYDIFSLDKNTNPPCYDSFDIKEIDSEALEFIESSNRNNNNNITHEDDGTDGDAKVNNDVNTDANNGNGNYMTIENGNSGKDTKEP